MVYKVNFAAMGKYARYEKDRLNRHSSINEGESTMTDAQIDAFIAKHPEIQEIRESFERRKKKKPKEK